MLKYQRKGEGYPLVLVHGYLGGSAMWRDQVVRFSSDYDVIAPDLAGFGESGALVSPVTIEAHAQSVLDLLDDLGIEDFHLLGHSMGGMVVQQMAAKAGKRISRLILYGTGPVGKLPDRFETMEESRRRLSDDGVAATALRIAATWFVAGSHAAGFQVCAEEGSKASLTAAQNGLTAMEHWDGRSALSGIKPPTLVLWGDWDRSYSWAQPETLWKNIPDCSLAVVPGCAHNVHMEKPDLFNRLVGDFLDERL
ncbi:alpha/beta fold hydrolase [Pelagibius sp. Alg239-R121]|uniref:alpha/beta fold hydrolase n=1 Tax=Pelagibius sp. Alg239-R121 TaxID=2993448 RepID=UPI0024A6EE8A|nr:alpha/beta hydrolase [Pelagibius sp. Alg239-R121]